MIRYPHKESEDLFMFTFLDLLVVVVMGLIAVGLLAIALMFLIKNKSIKQVCLYTIIALSIYIGYVALRIHWPFYTGESILAVFMILMSIGAFVLERIKLDFNHKFMISQIIATLSLVIGMTNAFI